MAYATSTGTLDQMIAAAASFALANGWTAPPTVGVRNYWRVSLSSRLGTGTQVSITDLIFRDSGGVDLGDPNTILFSSQDGSFPASGVFTGGEWRCAFGDSTPRKWVGGNYTTAVDVRQVTLTLKTSLSDYSQPIDISLDYSDDGITWKTFTTFSTGGEYSSGTYTYVYDPTSWPLVPGDGLLFMVTKHQDNGVGNLDATEYLTGGGSVTVYPTRVYLTMGKDQVCNVKTNFNEQGSLTQLLPDENIAEWHLFTDATVSHHIHLAFRTTHRGQPRWHHWSMGIADNRGLTHAGVGYLTVDGMLYFVNESGSGGSALWRSLTNTNPFARYGAQGISSHNNSYWRFLDGAGSSYPCPISGFPARGVTHSTEDWHVIPAGYWSGSIGKSQLTSNGSMNPPYGGHAMRASVHPVSGFATMGELPVGTAAGPLIDDNIALLGEIPNMRAIRVDNLSDGGEITNGADTWKTFPRIRKTDLDEMDVFYSVTSGYAGWAYKKVP